MKRYKIWSFLCLLVCLAGCNKDDIMRYDVKDSGVNFRVASTEFSFLDSEDKEKGIVEIPVQIMGPAMDHERTFAVEVVDSLTTAKPSDYTILETVIKPNEVTGVVKLQLNYTAALDNESKKLGLRCIANGDFSAGYPEHQTGIHPILYAYTTITWSNMLMKPANWRSWYFWFGTTYSRNFHLLVLGVLGEGAEKLQWYSEFGGPRTSQEECYALNRKLRKYVLDYNAANPDKPLMHSEDAVKYSGYNDPNPTPVGKTRIVIKTY